MVSKEDVESKQACCMSHAPDTNGAAAKEKMSAGEIWTFLINVCHLFQARSGKFWDNSLSA